MRVEKQVLCVKTSSIVEQQALAVMIRPVAITVLAIINLYHLYYLITIMWRLFNSDFRGRSQGRNRDVKSR